MKKVGILFFIVTAALLNYSCENTLNPNAPFRERYVLTGIMRSDTSLQVVTLTRSYRPADGFNPLTNTQDPAVIGAEVNIWYKDTLYELRDTTLVRQDTSHYKDSVHCYYVNNLRPEEDQYVDIEALLPNGLLLQSTTKLPDVRPYGFFSTGNDLVIPPVDKDFVMVKWDTLSNTISSPRINIIYYVKGSTEMKKWPVPLYYITNNDKTTPVYPGQTKINFVNLSMETITRALNEISQTVSDKSQISISEMDVELVVYDVSLSTYYLSIQGGLDAFTVKLDVPDYSDIQGGYGIFGSYVRTVYKMKFTNDYLKSLGYQ